MGQKSKQKKSREYGATACISDKVMRAPFKDAVILKITDHLRRVLSDCQNVTVSEPQADMIYEEYDESGYGIGEPQKVWSMVAVGDKD